MKKFKSVFFLFIFVLVSPLFAFACGETTFDDIPYVASSKTVEEVISEVDDTRDKMINSIGLKLSFPSGPLNQSPTCSKFQIRI